MQYVYSGAIDEDEDARIRSSADQLIIVGVEMSLLCLGVQHVFILFNCWRSAVE